MEDRIGSLEPGKYADIAVWSGNPVSAEAEEIRALEVEMTAVQGVIRHTKNP